MKKIILTLAVIAFAFQANAATTYKEASAVNGKTPMAVLVYARWAENYEDFLSVYRKMQDTLGKSYNFVELDIASEDAKEFNERYPIMPQLPYIMLYRSNGKFQRLLERSCASNLNCTIPKMKAFLR